MKAAIKLEKIGDDSAAMGRSAFGRLLGMPVRTPWCSLLTEYDEITNCFSREFIRGQKDYSDSNSKGSRGVYLYFWLESGSVYEIYELISWKRSRRWFAAVTDDGKVVEIKREDAILCLS